MTVQFEAVCSPTFMAFWDDVGGHCSCQRTCPIVYIMFHSEDRPLNLPLSCEVIEKNVVFGPPIFWEGYTPDFGHAFSNHTYVRARGRFSLSSVQRAWRVGDEKRRKKERKKERRIPIKRKSADKYVGRPNNNICTGHHASRPT